MLARTRCASRTRPKLTSEQGLGVGALNCRNAEMLPHARDLGFECRDAVKEFVMRQRAKVCLRKFRERIISTSR